MALDPDRQVGAARRAWWDAVAASGGFDTSAPGDAIRLGALVRYTTAMIEKRDRRQEWLVKVLTGLATTLLSAAIGFGASAVWHIIST